MLKRTAWNELIMWKNNINKLPLIIYGARQVGKTYIMAQFAKKYYKNYIYVNFDADTEVAKIFNRDLNIERIIAELEIYFNKRISPKTTILFFDEIQNKPKILQSLKYFAENKTKYNVVVAGSLLGVAIDRQKQTFPVGKVEIIKLKPLSFLEFLWSQNEHMLSDAINQSTISHNKINPALHKKALDLFKRFLILGGLPASINSFNEYKTFLQPQKILTNIVNGYLSDMTKYVTNVESIKIRSTYNSIPKQLANQNKKFKYSAIQKDGNFEKFSLPISWLEFAGLIIKSNKINIPQIPLSAYKDDNYFKLYFHDVGILTMLSKTPIIDILHFDETDNKYFGAIAENYVATCLYNLEIPAYYWRSKNTAEVDFVLQISNKIFPIEVKKGLRTKSKSLNIYKDKYNPEKAIRISAKNFGDYNGILSIPLYATEFLFQNYIKTQESP